MVSCYFFALTLEKERTYIPPFGVHKLGEDLPSQTAYFRYFEDFFFKNIIKTYVCFFRYVS